MSAQCIVCGKTVATTDQQEHLATNHLGPHYFWFDAKKHRTMKPSMTMGEIVVMVGASPMYLCYEDRDNVMRGIGHGEAVDLTCEPHFCAIPPATY